MDHRLKVGLIALLLLSSPRIYEPPEQAPPPASVFLLEVPELNIAPTERPEVTIPSPRLNLIIVHILRPAADSMDYGQIFPFINGEAAATISETVTGERGKLLRIHLDYRADFRLVPGRNSIEVRAQNRRGRTYYVSFVLRTATENRNQDFSYTVAFAGDAKQQVPPELVLQEPESTILIPPGRPSSSVRVAGVASAATAVERVTVNGQSVALKRGPPAAARHLRIANEDKQVAFATTINVTPAMARVVVEATDAAGNRTSLAVAVQVADAAPPQEFRGKKYALIVGISKFRYTQPGFDNLQYADEDARAVQQFLLSSAGGRFAAENVLLLTNEQATLERLREALSRFAVQPAAGDLLLIFFASHGGPDPSAEQNLYFLAHDSRLDDLAGTALPMPDLQRLLQQNVRARRVVMLVDTCHSAGLGSVQARGLRNNLINLYAERVLYREEGRAVITSSDINEDSLEGARWGGGHGVFTHFLLEGLQGKADRDGDRFITVAELFSYVRQRVQEETEAKQHPRILINTNDALVMAAVPARK
ncbi:MAG TPA: caspase family protein [Blastocatellia bacterium]|nr:caspase family protein [Blastocatellia bacterium]